jgi:hypothetical protein
MTEAADLTQIDETISALMGSLAAPARAKAAGQIARIIRGSQAKRIASGSNPDGSAFAPRKAIAAKPRTINKTLKFLYPAGGGGQARTVLLKSWTKNGPIYTGYDGEAGAVRSFNANKIIRHLPTSPGEENKGGAGPKRKTRSSVKSRLMFRKLRTYREIKSGSSAAEAWVGFTGASARIAAIHQEGGLDRASRKGPLVRYARRQLLGLTDNETSQIMDVLFKMVDV